MTKRKQNHNKWIVDKFWNIENGEMFFPVGKIDLLIKVSDKELKIHVNNTIINNTGINKKEIDKLYNWLKLVKTKYLEACKKDEIEFRTIQNKAFKILKGGCK